MSIAHLCQSLFHSFLDHERPALWLREVVDPMESEGYVHIPQRQGLEIDWDYIEENRVKIE